MFLKFAPLEVKRFLQYLVIHFYFYFYIWRSHVATLTTVMKTVFPFSLVPHDGAVMCLSCVLLLESSSSPPLLHGQAAVSQTWVHAVGVTHSLYPHYLSLSFLYHFCISSSSRINPIFSSFSFNPLSEHRGHQVWITFDPMPATIQFMLL